MPRGKNIHREKLAIACDLDPQVIGHLWAALKLRACRACREWHGPRPYLFSGDRNFAWKTAQDRRDTPQEADVPLSRRPVGLSERTL